MGYDPQLVDAFLSHIGAGHAAGVDAGTLTLAIHKVRFPLVSRGYDTRQIDQQLQDLANQLSRVEMHDREVISVFAAAA